MIKDTNPLHKLSMRIEFADGRYFNLYSRHANILGWRKFFGWCFITFGLNIMFGRKSEWTIYHNSERKEGERIDND